MMTHALSVSGLAFPVTSSYTTIKVADCFESTVDRYIILAAFSLFHANLTIVALKRTTTVIAVKPCLALVFAENKNRQLNI